MSCCPTLAWRPYETPIGLPRCRIFLTFTTQECRCCAAREDFFDLAFAYLEKVATQNVTHVEICFDPQGHTDRGISFDTVLSGLTDALDKGLRDFGITSRLIMCFLRHLPEEQAFDTLRHACRCREHIFAVGT